MNNPVRIERYGAALVAPASIEPLVQHALTYWRRKQSGPKAVEMVQTKLYAIKGERLITSYGLYHRLSKTLENLQYPVEYVEHWGCRVGLPDYTRLDNLREGQDELVIALTAYDWGVVEAPTGTGKSFLIAQVCKIYPTANIIICSPFASVIRQTYADLQETLRPHEVGMIGDGKLERGMRVTCVLDRSLMKCDLEKVDIFMYDEVHRAAAPKTSECLAKLTHAKRIGFSASPTGRSDNADLETEALFGPIIVRLSYEEVEKTGNVVPIDVLVVGTASVPPVEGSTMTSIERNGVWRNEKRNGLIADTVRELEAEIGEEAQVLISVETVEHAVFLGKLMPDYALVYASMDRENLIRWVKWGLLPKDYEALKPAAKEELRKAFRSGELRKVIATGTWGTGTDFPKLNVIVRADAQASSILNTQIPGRVTRKSEGKTVGIVVDFDDVFNSTLANRSKKRLRLYRKKGWNIRFKAAHVPPYQTQ